MSGRGRQLWLGFLVTALAVVVNARSAAAKEPPPAACTPPCQPGETCFGGACMVPAARPNPPPAFPPPPGAPPPAYPPSPPPGAPPPLGAPPVYAPAAGYRPPPPMPPPVGFYEDAAKPVRTRRFMAVPYIGTHSYQSEANRAYFPGFRIGTLIGGRVTEQLSLNWELTFDISNIDTAPATPSSSEFAFDFAFSPMFHIPAGVAEFLVGPKLGVFWVHTDVRNNSSYTTESHQGTGILGGLTAGTFMNVSSTVALGFLLSGELRKVEHACTVNPGEIALCDLARDGSAAVAGLTAAAIFR